MFTYPGTIKVNGKELKHASMGIHTVTEPAGSGNKKVSFENGTVEGTLKSRCRRKILNCFRKWPAEEC